jgi:hypothetical protein
MTRDFSKIYINAISIILDKLIEGVFDVVSSFDQCSKVEMLVKLGKLTWLKDMFADLVPSDFDKSNLSLVNQHLHFVNYYYIEKKDFKMLKHNADDLVMRDIPALKRDLDVFRRSEITKEERRMPESSVGHVSQVATDIQNNLRRLVRNRPNKEKEVQDHLEDLLALKGYEFQREKVTIPYSTKSYTPDFTSEYLNMAIDVKLCNSPNDEKSIIDEINADIPAYKTRYQYLLFVVYDIAIIRRLRDYTSDIEKNNSNVTVLVIKH